MKQQLSEALASKIRWLPVLWRKPCYWIGHDWWCWLIAGSVSRFRCRRCGLGMTKHDDDAVTVGGVS